MPLLIIIFGIFSGCFLSVLVGLFGRERNIGFGWAFVISLFFTPLIGLLAVLLSEKTGTVQTDNYGCLGSLFSIIGGIIAVIITLFLLLFFAV